MFASMPPRMILLIRRLASCRTRSLVCGPHTLCGLTTIVFPSSIYRLKRSSQSAPEFEKTGQIQRSASRKGVGSELVGLERSVHLPTVVGRIKIMGRDEHFISARLRCVEDPLHVLNRAVLDDARADRFPICSLLAQHIVLRVEKHDCGVGLLDLHGLLLLCMQDLGTILDGR